MLRKLRLRQKNGILRKKTCNEIDQIQVGFNANKLSPTLIKENLFFSISSTKKITCENTQSGNLKNKHHSTLGVLSDEHLTWNHYIHQLQSTISKSIRRMYKAKKVSSPKLLKSIYSLFIHSYLKEGNSRVDLFSRVIFLLISRIGYRWIFRKNLFSGKSRLIF